jgi:hypothetical protein
MRILAEKRGFLSKRPALMIDETNVVDDLWEPDAARTFVQHLLSFARRYPDINIVLSMQEDLYRTASIGNVLPSAGLLDIGTNIRLGYLSNRATRQVILEPMQSMLEYEELAVDRIASLTAGHPYYLQRILERVVEGTAVERCEIVTEEWLDSVLEQVLDNQYEFHDFLRKTKGLERPVLVALADTCAEQNGAATLQQVGEALKTSNNQQCLDDVEKALEQLYLVGIVQRNDGPNGAVYHIDVPLFQRWLVRTRLAALQSRPLNRPEI